MNVNTKIMLAMAAGVVLILMSDYDTWKTRSDFDDEFHGLRASPPRALPPNLIICGIYIDR